VSLRTLILLTPLALAQQPCESLTQLKINKVTINASAPNGKSCVVKATARPTKDSEINFEVWLPLEGWNGRYQQSGNVGWAGAVPVAALQRASEKGYAAAGTDDGHPRGAGDAAWAIGHPEKLIDFGHRAVHVTSVHAKTIIKAFYGREAAKSYFVGCSDGGREALMEAQRYPEDFDGIIAGAPAYDWSNHFAGFVWNEQTLVESPIPPAKLPAIQKAAVAACDAIDGVTDGLIDDPRNCRFDPSVLLCTAGESDECLNSGQLTTLTRIYAGPRNPRTGKQIYPGYPPGTEAVPGSWTNWMISTSQARPAQFNFGNSFFGQAVFENPKWDFRTLDFDADVDYAYKKAGVHLNSSNPDLRSFRANGGKMISYHGWGDGAISGFSSINYYDNVLSFFARYPDARARANAPVQDFFRLFMVPGMGHCAGGIGPNRFGNTANSPADPEHNIIAALERWVEQGVAPEKIIATGDAPKPFTRPLCPYPQTVKYKGTGDPNDAANFSCVN
jgi:feruloyl esterase